MNESKTALVTGANKGIGFEIAAGLARLNYRVAVGARDDDRRDAAVVKLREPGANVFGVRLEVSSDDSVAAAIASLEGEVDHLAVIVNNVGISGPKAEDAMQDPLTVSFEVIRTDVETNILGAMRVINSALPLLQRSPSPRIVNVSTDMASLTLRTGPIMAAYSPSKTILNAITVQYARRFEGNGIQINAVCPGYVASDFTGHAESARPSRGQPSRSAPPPSPTTGRPAGSTTRTGSSRGDVPSQHPTPRPPAPPHARRLIAVSGWRASRGTPGGPVKR